MAERTDTHGRHPLYVRQGAADSDETTATIAAGQSLSGAVDTEGLALAAILMPADWTVADITFQVSNAADGVFRDLYDDVGNEIRIPTAVNRAVSLDVLALAMSPYQFFKVRSGTATVPVVQVAQAVLTMLLRGR